jgi:hypothetical protein
MAREETKPLSERPRERPVHHVASTAVSFVAARPATTASSTGSTRSVASGSPGPLADSLLARVATARATRVSCAMTDQRRAATGRRTPESWEASDSRTTSPTATHATAKAAASTRPPEIQLVAGSGSGSPGTSQPRTSRTDRPRPKATPSGVAIRSSATGSARPSPHSRRAVTPRSDASASSGTRSSLAALSRRIRSARATSTSDSTAGAMELRAVDCWKRTSSTTSASELVSSLRIVPPSTSISVSLGIAFAASAASSSWPGSRSAGTSSAVSTRTVHPPIAVRVSSVVISGAGW